MKQVIQILLVFFKYKKKSGKNLTFIWYQRPDLNRHKLKARGILSPLCLPIPPLRREFGGDTRIRTGDKDFADLCLTTWRCRQNPKWSGRRDSNSRQPRWQRGALPLSYSRSLQKAKSEFMVFLSNYLYTQLER